MQYRKGGEYTDKRLNFSVPESIYDAIKQEGEEKGLSLAAMIRVILLEHIGKRKK